MKIGKWMLIVLTVLLSALWTGTAFAASSGPQIKLIETGNTQEYEITVINWSKEAYGFQFTMMADQAISKYEMNWYDKSSTSFTKTTSKINNNTTDFTFYYDKVSPISEGDTATIGTITIKDNTNVAWSAMGVFKIIDEDIQPASFNLNQPNIPIVKADEVTYSVTVKNGTGSGSYKIGQSVSIIANEPAVGKQFAGWKSNDGVQFSNSGSANTSFIMLGKSVTVEAAYEDKQTSTPDPKPEEKPNYTKSDNDSGSNDSNVSGKWMTTDGRWWFLKSDGTYVQNTWAKLYSKWYWFGADGYMTTGWQKVGDKWYYMDTTGAMLEGWILVDGKWYYCNQSGEMLANTTTSEGYKLASDGVWIQ